MSPARAATRDGLEAMGTIMRMWAVITGHKLIRLALSPREGGYVLITSPDLPGYSLMLHPGEMESFGSMTAAVSGPLEAFLAAEQQAARSNKKKVQIRGMRQTTDSNIVAELCAA